VAKETFQWGNQDKVVAVSLLKIGCMKKITILYPEGLCNLSTAACIIGTVEILNRAELHWVKQGNAPAYELCVAGIEKQDGYINELVALKASASIKDIDETALIIIPSAMPGDQTPAQQVMFDWIEKQYKMGAEIASMCSGAFILAATGIMNGIGCSTHWSFADKFKALYPEVNLQTDKIITHEKGIYTNGGAYSFLNLVLYLVEKYYNREIAILCAKIFQIEIDRNHQSAFAIFSGQKQHHDELIREAQYYIEQHVEEKISVDHLSASFAIGRRNFDRRFVKATGNSPMEYIQRVKIESAKKMLETTRKTIYEVMYDVGYTDIKSFREVFRKITGITPLEYRNRYNNEATVV
jgi:transcriptional regulator GlxA family with amidase domain